MEIKKKLEKEEEMEEEFKLFILRSKGASSNALSYLFTNST